MLASHFSFLLGRWWVFSGSVNSNRGDWGNCRFIIARVVVMLFIILMDCALSRGEVAMRCMDLLLVLDLGFGVPRFGLLSFFFS